MLTKLLRSFAQKVTLPIGRALAAAGLTANHMTVMGAIVTSAAAWFVALGRLRLGGLVMVAGAIFDMLDGAVARARQSPTKRGAFLDSTLDRYSDAVIFAALAFYLSRPLTVTSGMFTHLFVPPTGLLIPLGLTLACLILGFLTSYIRARAESLGLDCSVGIAERAERSMLVMAGLVFSPFLIPALVLLTALSAITVVQRFVHVWKQTKDAEA